MFFIFGISQKEEKLDFSETIICPACGSYGRMEVFCSYSYFSLFFIPLFRWGRKYFVKATCCGSVCAIDRALGDSIRKGETGRIDPSSLSFKSVTRCRICGYIPKGEKCTFCPECGSRLN